MKRLLQLIVSAGLGLVLISCGSNKQQGSSSRTISSVNPYSGLSDQEIKSQYLVRLLELQALNKEMEAANNAKDYGLVNRKAKEGLVKAYEARSLARNLDDSRQRSERLSGIEKIITDLNTLVRITGG